MNTNDVQMCAKTTLASSKKDPNPSQLVLMTAEGNVWNHRKGGYKKILFFFDTGAQKTVIEESLAESLGVQKQATETCTMSGIGGHIERFKSHNVIIKVSTAYGEELNLNVQTKPVITSGFPSINLSAEDVSFLKTRSICLANSKLRGEHQKPHILVGLDHYHELVTGSVNSLQTPSGLHIANTVFGPTLYGKGAVERIDATICYGMTSIQESTKQENLKKMSRLDGQKTSLEVRQKSEGALEYLAQNSKNVSFCGVLTNEIFPSRGSVSQLDTMNNSSENNSRTEAATQFETCPKNPATDSGSSEELLVLRGAKIVCKSQLHECFCVKNVIQNKKETEFGHLDHHSNCTRFKKQSIKAYRSPNENSSKISFEEDLILRRNKSHGRITDMVTSTGGLRNQQSSSCRSIRLYIDSQTNYFFRQFGVRMIERVIRADRTQSRNPPA